MEGCGIGNGKACSRVLSTVGLVRRSSPGDRVLMEVGISGEALSSLAGVTGRLTRVGRGGGLGVVMSGI